MPILHAFGRCFRITVEVNGAAKEEFVKDGQTWIGVEPGEAFQVKVEAEAAPASTDPNIRHRLQLALDGKKTWWFAFNMEEYTYTYQGFDMLGDGSQIRAYTFGEPGEEASGNRADVLGISLTAELVKLTTQKRRVKASSGRPDGSKRCKKFYQPHIEAGDKIEADEVNKRGCTTAVYRKINGSESFVCSIRYATVEGLAIRGVVSRETHPHLFDDKKSRKHRAARSPLVKEEPTAKKAKPEVIEIE